MALSFATEEKEKKVQTKNGEKKKKKKKGLLWRAWDRSFDGSVKRKL
jgi:hypothetical protein